MATVFNNINDWLSGGDLGDATAALKASANVVGGTSLPDLTALIPQLQKQVQQGTMTAAEAQAAIQQASAAAGLNTAPSADQLDALAREKGIATQGGMTAIDKAQLNDIQQQLANQNSAQQQAIDTAAAQQGQSSSGSRLAQKMLASQGNSTGAANAGATVAANAQARALQALQNYGTGANTIQTNQFNQQKGVADAQDAISRFNAQNQQSTNALNAQQQQAANAQNFTTANNIAGNNTTIANNQAMLPITETQQNFSNELNRNTATSNALNKQGTALLDQGNKNAATNAGYVQAAVAAAPAVASAAGSIWDGLSSYFSDEEKKKDIKPADESIEQMMENLTGKKFKYKGGNGTEHVSVMAQDLEKSPLTKSSVIDTPDGKMVQPDAKLLAAMQAALGNLHQRVSSMENK